MVNKYGCRPVTIVGAIIAGIGLAVSIFAPTIEVLYLTVGLLAGTNLYFGKLSRDLLMMLRSRVSQVVINWILGKVAIKVPGI
jgi:hypothetical protein